MHKTKGFIILLLAFTLIFTLFSCGDCEHVDANEDGVCDNCEEVVETSTQKSEVKLIENGALTFQLVVEDEVSEAVVAAIDSFAANLERLGVTLTRVGDTAESAKDIEVLVGDITSRGSQYKFDKYSLGYDGYIIKIVGTKVLITAGSDDALIHAFEDFAEIILGIDDESEAMPKAFTMTNDDEVDNTETSFRITSFKINGQDVSAYTIATDLTSEYHLKAANAIQTAIYKRTGHFFKIVEEEKAENSVIIKLVDKASLSANGFKVSVNDKNQLLVECAYLNKLNTGVDEFLAAAIELASGEVNFTGTVYESFNASVLYYEDFGAVGDGVTDDFVPIYSTHVTANQTGQTVMATSGKTYYIKESLINGKAVAVPVKTNVNWGNAKFIIDDRDIAPHADIDKLTNSMGKLAIFNIQSDYEAVTLDDKATLKALLDAGFNKKTTKIDLGEGFEYGAMIVPYNKSHKIYRRKDYDAFAGEAMHELIVIDKDGNVDPTTPLMWDYYNLDYITVYRLDGVTPITIEGGEFTTRAAQANCIYIRSDGMRMYYSPYINRGLNVTRPYTTVKNVKHYVTDEAPFSTHVNLETQKIEYVGSTYRGFFISSNTSDVLFEDCVLTGRRSYRRPNGGTGGTYDLSGTCVNRIVFKNCTQSNFWVTVDPENGNIKAVKEGTANAIPCMETFPILMHVDSGTNYGGGGLTTSQMHWGTGGTNYCKNMEYIGSTISRYDAHQGVYNGKVVDSTVCAIALTGGGEMIIENTRTFTTGGNRVFSTRSDYGYTWDGTVYVNNVSAFIHAKNADGTYADDIGIMTRSFVNWYWGYNPRIPNVVINDVYFYDIDAYNYAEKTYDIVPSTVPISLVGTSITPDSMIHMPECYVNPIYSIEDKNGNHLVDIPDIDADGIWGDLDLNYDETKTSVGSDNVDSGITDSRYLKGELCPNLSKTAPPEYFKILSNKGGYKFYVCNTGAYSDDPAKKVSSGGYHGVEENWKGFFGSTKFYYGPGENDYYQGPPKESEKNPNDVHYVFYTPVPEE